MSTDTVPTYAEIVAASDPKTFPLWALEGVVHAMCAYTSAFYGRQDVVHFAVAGVPRVYVVDVAGIDDMRSVYSKFSDGWTFHEGTFLDAVEEHRRPSWLINWSDRPDSEFLTQDLVTLDPWTQDMPRVWSEEVPLALKIAPRVIVGYCAAPFDHTGDPLANVKRIAPEGSTVDEVLQRSGHRGGVFWAVVSR